MSSQDIVVREDYLGPSPIPPSPLENTDNVYKLHMERSDGIFLLYNRPSDPNFGHRGGIWYQALPDEPDKPPMCQYINKSLDNIATVVVTQERWMRRATDYLTQPCPYEFIQIQCREMTKIWPVDQMPAWVPVLRERWAIVNRAKKENRDEWETFLQGCESSNDVNLLQVARAARQGRVHPTQTKALSLPNPRSQDREHQAIYPHLHESQTTLLGSLPSSPTYPAASPYTLK